MYHRKCVLAGLALLALTGCGGAKTARYPLASTTRALQAGDSWSYSVRTESRGESYDGTAVISLSEETLEGTPVLARSVVTPSLPDESGLYGADGGPTRTSPPPTDMSVVYLSQEPATRDVLQVGDVGKGKSRKLKIPQRIIPGDWNQGTVLTSQFVYDAQPEKEASATIIGTEAVRTPLGFFDTWKMQVTQNAATGISSTETYWYAPQIGAFVRLEGTYRRSDQTVSRTFVLTSTSVPLQP